MDDYKPPYLHAAAVSLALFALYVVTLSPTTWFWDTSEYIATAHIFGLPHPPGNPLFVAVGKVWTLLLAPTGLSIAVRINLMAAVTSAVSAGLLFLVGHRILSGWLGTMPAADADAEPEDPRFHRLFPLAGAWIGAILAGTALTVWNQSTVNEKVYTLSVLIIAIVSWLVVRWLDQKDRPGSAWLLLLAVYLMVLGTTNHLMSMLPAPALGLALLSEKPRLLADWRFLGRGAIAVLIGLSFNLVLPIRSADQPRINEGEPICESVSGAVTAVYTLGRAGCEPLAANLTREQYAKPSIFTDPTTAMTDPQPRSLGLLTHQVLNYFQYFDWQWARGLAVSELPGNARLPFTLVFLGLGLWGLAVTARVGRGHGVYLGTLALTLTLGLVVYLNFRYGYSLGPGLETATGEPVDREVRERDYFFVASFQLWGLLAGLGLVAAWRWAAGGRLVSRPLALASPVLALAVVPLVFNWAWASRSGDHSARDWAYDILQSVEPYGILFTNGDNDTFPLWYLQEVEGIREDVTVIVVQYLNTDWYPRQLKYQTEPERQRSFDPADDTGVYPLPASPPTRAITTFSDSDLDQVGYTVLREETTVMVGDQPVRYPAGFQFTRADLISLAIIQDSMPERPIHFASTGAQASVLGLEPYVVRQGLASKLTFRDLESDPGVIRVSDAMGGEWIDLETSLELATEVFTYRGLQDREIWADRATLNIPLHFYFLYLQMADALGSIVDSQELPEEDRIAMESAIEELLDEADGFRVTGQGGSAAFR